MQQATPERILRVLAEQTSIRAEDIQDEHDLRRDLNCDSLDLVEIAIALEVEFQLDIDEDAFERLATVQEVINYITGVCTIQHPAADTREHKVAVLKKCALDAAIELDWLKNEFNVPADKRGTIAQIVERTHHALSQLATTEEIQASQAAEDEPEQVPA